MGTSGGVVASSLDGAWSLTFAGVQRTWAVCPASVLLSQVLVEATPAAHLRQRHITIRKVPGWYIAADAMRQRLRYVRCWLLVNIGGRRAATTP